MTPVLKLGFCPPIDQPRALARRSRSERTGLPRLWSRALVCSTARCRFDGLRSWLRIPSVIPRRPPETPESNSASANNRFSRLFSFLRSFSRLAAVFFGGHRTSSIHEYVCSVTPIFLTASATVLPRPTSTSNSRSIGDDLLGQFFLSAWHGMPSFSFDTTRFSLWRWCR